MHRNLQRLNLSSAYRDDDDIRHFCCKLASLAFLPLDRMPEAVHILREAAGQLPDPVLEYFEYFDQTYISGRRYVEVTPQGVVVRRAPPQFHPVLWNQHAAILERRGRTNNVCEGWNSMLKSTLGHAHPRLRELVHFLKEEVVLVSTQLASIDNGTMVEHASAIEEQRRQAMLDLCQDLLDGDLNVPQFISAVAHRLRIVRQ